MEAKRTADAGMLTSIYTRYPFLRERYLRVAQMHRMPLFHLKPTLPTIGGGIAPANAVRIIHDLGADIMLAVGGAIQGHPESAPAGARAMRQAIDAALRGVPLHEAAREHPELKRALELWGDQHPNADGGAHIADRIPPPNHPSRAGSLLRRPRHRDRHARQ